VEEILERLASSRIQTKVDDRVRNNGHVTQLKSTRKVCTEKPVLSGPIQDRKLVSD